MWHHMRIPPFIDFIDYTAVLPKMYWDVYSAEQRIHEICKTIGKLVAYADAINEHANELDDGFEGWEEKLEALDLYAHELETKFDTEQKAQTTELKQYTDAQVLALDIALRELINNITIDTIPVLDPEDSESYKDLDAVLQYNYNNLRYMAASSTSYDAKEYTALDYDNSGLSAYEFDFYSTSKLLEGDGDKNTYDGAYFISEISRMIGEGAVEDLRAQVNQNSDDIRAINSTITNKIEPAIADVKNTLEPQIETNTTNIATNTSDIKTIKSTTSYYINGYGDVCKIAIGTKNTGLTLNTTEVSLYNHLYKSKTTGLTYSTLEIPENETINIASISNLRGPKWSVLSYHPIGDLNQTEMSKKWYALFQYENVSGRNIFILDGIYSLSFTIKTGTVTETPKVHALMVVSGSGLWSYAGGYGPLLIGEDYPVWQMPSASSNDYYNINCNFVIPHAKYNVAPYIGFCFAASSSVESFHNINIDYIPSYF